MPKHGSKPLGKIARNAQASARKRNTLKASTIGRLKPGKKTPK